MRGNSPRNTFPVAFAAVHIYAKGEIVTHTLSIDRVVTTTADVAVPQMVQSGFSLVSTTRDAAAGVIEAVYSIPTGDANYPTTIVVRTARNPKDRAGVARHLIAINTFARDLDGVTGLEVVKPISAVLTIQVPNMSVEAADLATLIGNLYGLSFNTLTAKVPDTAVLSGLQFGLVEAF